MVAATTLAASSIALASPAAAATNVPAPSTLVPVPALAPPAPPKGSVALGPASGAQAMSVDVVLSPSHPGQLASLLAALYDPRSPQYHHWLAPGQFDTRFAPSSSAVASATQWLASRGLSVRRASEFSLAATASTGQLSSALGTSFERYRTPAGAQGYVASGAPLVPAGLQGSIHAVLGLSTLPAFGSNLSSAPPQHRRAAAGGVHAASLPAGTVHSASLPTACPAAQSVASSGFYTMDQLGTAYGIDPVLNEGLTGRGQTIGVFELAPHDQSDISAYESCFGLSNPVSTVAVDGGGTSDAGGTAEADLDIEQAITQAPGASVVSYEGPNTQAGSYDTWNTIISSDQASVISSSWDVCESASYYSGEMASMSVLFQQAAAQGQTILVASGDSGSEGCYQANGSTALQVQYPASDPYVTAVGGTSLLAPGDEVTWNSCQGQESLICASDYQGQAAGGGGLSQYESRPSYQPAVLQWSTTQPCGTSCREVPDIAANAGVGMVLYSGGQWNVGDGTSFAAPFVAGLVADRNQGCASLTGQFNPALYQLAAHGGYGTALTDITSGNNDMTGSHNGLYQAGPGYDGATGLGSPVFSGLTCPEVTSVVPADAAPGSTVTVYGTGLEGTTISFGSVAAVATAESATTATVTVPSGSGTAAISAAGILGQGTLSAPFSYASTASSGTAPTTTSTSTTSGPTSTSTTPTSTAPTSTAPTSTSPTSTAAPPAPACVTRSGPLLPGASGIAAVEVGGCAGYLVTDSAGQVSAFGAAVWRGDLSGVHLNAPIIAIESTPDGGGYWLLGADGGIFSFGDAGFYGSTGGIHLAAPVVGMASTPDGRGYWLVAADGGVFSFGDATFHGSTGGMHLAQPVDGMAVAPGGNGYWLVARDGGVFAFTPDGFFGSLGGVRLARPIVGMSGTPDGRGYTLVGSDGGVFSFGDAPFYGSLGSNPPASPVVDLSPVPGGQGYYLITASGQVYTFGPGAAYFGSV